MKGGIIDPKARENNKKLGQNKEKYLVYGIFGSRENQAYITFMSINDPISIEFEQDCEIIDNTPSKYWIKYDDYTLLPEGWNDTNFLYELVDDLDPLTNDKFKSAKEKIDEEFADYFIDDSVQYQDPNIKIGAEPIGENWVLCPECHEVFEVSPDQGVVKCPNIACRELLNNPYAPKMPKEHKKE